MAESRILDNRVLIDRVSIKVIGCASNELHRRTSTRGERTPPLGELGCRGACGSEGGLGSHDHGSSCAPSQTIPRAAVWVLQRQERSDVRYERARVGRVETN